MLCIAFVLTAVVTAHPAEVEPVDGGPDWTVALSAQGDLNGDGVRDEAEIVAASGPRPAVSLRVFFGRENGPRQLAAEAPNAVCRDCGGLKGAGEIPFEMRIERGVLILEHSGGSHEVWKKRTVWRFQQGKFALIGASAETTDVGSLSRTLVDANISTLRMNETSRWTIDAQPVLGGPTFKTKQRSCRVPRAYQEVTLTDFEVETFRSPTCPPEPER